jgi:acetylornithine/N-succinyldiaminopimelate aminotransferase
MAGVRVRLAPRGRQSSTSTSRSTSRRMEADPAPNLGTSQRLNDLFHRHLCQTSVSPMGLVVERARGARVFTRDGREYLDFMAGICVANIGHTHPAVVAAVQRQAAEFLHVMVYGEYVLPVQVELAARLARLAPDPLDTVYFTNSGTEANEGALKLAKKRTGRRRLIAFEGSFHGDSHGSLSVTGREVYRRPFEPLLPEVEFLPFNEPSALARIDGSVAGVITEPIQGEGGIRVPDDDFLAALRRHCTEVGALLIFDEVQTGMGRTGAMFALEHWGVVPDVLVLAKALGAGLPLGAFIGAAETMRALSVDPPLSHVTTFGGNPVCCAAALAGLEVLEQERLPERAAATGTALREALWALGRNIGGVIDVRGKGMHIGLELESPALTERFVRGAFDRGLILGWTLHTQRVVRIAPPLNLSDGELAEGLEIISQSLMQALDGRPDG